MFNLVALIYIVTVIKRPAVLSGSFLKIIVHGKLQWPQFHHVLVLAEARVNDYLAGKL